MRRALFLLATALCALPAAAQAPAAPVERQPLEPGRANQKIEHIHHEDAHTRIDELRIGGHTERITVQPKGRMPGYEMQPEAPSADRPGANSSDLSAPSSQRKWNVLKF